jgi:ribosomal protein S12 methylthiotransferase accessory factor
LAALDARLRYSCPSPRAGGHPLTTDLWQKLRADTSAPRYRLGTLRAAPPQATLRRLRPLLRAAGITRLADVTGLDRVGLPVFQAIRPNSRVLSVSQGKGLTREQGQVSALMEALEGFHAEEIPQPSVRETVGAMRPHLGYDPYALPLSRPSLLSDAVALDWVPATELTSGVASWAPRQLCELDACVEDRVHVPLFRASSNGLAAGNTVAEALLHGLCEVIERDCCTRYGEARLDPKQCVEPESVRPPLGRHLLSLMSHAGMDLRIVDLTGPTGLPCFEVWLDHPDGPTVTVGSGCHPNRLTALVRAATEAAQSRLAYISGSRDDIPRAIYREPTVRVPRRPARLEMQRRFADAPTLRAGGFSAQVREVAGRVRALTGMSPIAVDLTRRDFGIPVVFVLAPGLMPPELE